MKFIGHLLKLLNPSIPWLITFRSFLQLHFENFLKNYENFANRHPVYSLPSGHSRINQISKSISLFLFIEILRQQFFEKQFLHLTTICSKKKNNISDQIFTNTFKIFTLKCKFQRRKIFDRLSISQEKIL